MEDPVRVLVVDDHFVVRKGVCALLADAAGIVVAGEAAREDEVLVLLAQGWSNRRISEELSIGEITVRTHVSHIFGKLGVSNRVEAALHALRSGKASLQNV